MSPLYFLAIPAITITVGCLWLWARARKPQSVTSGVDDFRREMQALAPDNDRFRPRHGPEGGGGA